MPPREYFSESKLLKIWVAAGRSEGEFFARKPISLDDYEESKLGLASVDLSKSRSFFERFKALHGEREFALFCGEAAERQGFVDANPDYKGFKPRNPTGALIKLAEKKLSESAAKGAGAGAPALALQPLPPTAQPIPTRRAPAFFMNGGAEPNDEQLIGFSSRVLVSCNLPHTDPGDVPFWTRSNGTDTLVITRGTETKGGVTKVVGYPYGTMPRLISIYFATEAVRTKNPTIHLGDSFNEFIRRLGLEKSGPGHAMLRDQLYRLIKAKIEYTRQPGRADAAGDTGINATIADGWQLWWDPKASANEPMLFESVVVLNQSFFRQVVKHGFPVDLRAVADMRKSPLAIDLYGWLAYRVSTLERPLKLSNEVLQKQLGTDFKRSADFAKQLRLALARVQKNWTTLNCETFRGGMILKPSATPIPRDQSALGR